MLPPEIFDKIALLCRDKNVNISLSGYITMYAKKKMRAGSKTILVHGQVQGGKTRKIISFMHHFSDCINVLVIQNSRAVLKQYESRLAGEGLDYQTVDKSTRKINKKIILVMANVHRYGHFKKVAPKVYNLVIDEADSLVKRCPLKGEINVHVTATPFAMGNIYDRIISIQRNPNYRGLENFTRNSTDSGEAVYNFLNTGSGIMLLNEHCLISSMYSQAIELAVKHQGIPIVVLSSIKSIMIFDKGWINTPGTGKTISQIIDHLYSHTHIIIIADRLTSRGLSFVSSDYKRHLTAHFIARCTSSTSFIQKMRMSGIYADNQELVLTVDPKIVHKIDRIDNDIATFNVMSLLKD